MKSSSIILFALLLCFFAPSRFAAAAPSETKPFDRMKSLVGTWEGKHATPNGIEKVAVTYTLTSGGTALVETLMPGTPHEMVTVYHKEGEGLLMTHYCMLGNQPRMKLTQSTPTELDFDFAGGSNISPKKDSHMHSLKLVIPDENHLVQKWAFYDQGKEKSIEVFSYQKIERKS